MPPPMPESPLIPISILPSSLGSHLLPNEEVLSLSPSIGLYSHSIKLPNHQDGTIYLTSHRIIYIDSNSPRTHSGYLRLEDVKLTEYYAGFLKSSPKVIIGLDIGDREGDAQRRAEVARLQDEMAISTSVAVVDLNGSSGRTLSSARAATASASAAVIRRWVCTVCGFGNQGAEGGSETCQLCGVRKDPTASTSRASDPQTGGVTSSARKLDPPPSRRPSQGAQQDATALVPRDTACPACTFHNHPSMQTCEVCGTSLATMQIPMTSNAPVQPSDANSLPATPAVSRPATPGPPKGPIGEVTVKVSFRKGGDKAFYEALNRAMRRAAWKRPAASTPSTEIHRTGARPESSAGQRGSSLRAQAVVDIDGRHSSAGSSSTIVGIDGLLNAYSHKSALESSDMSNALQDLKGLMAKAKDMVELAESLNAKLSKREAEHATSSSETSDDQAAEEEAATLIRSSLVRLGLPTTAITKEMAKDEEEYHQELARELGYVLLGGRNTGTSRGGSSGPSTSISGILGTGRVLSKGERPRDSTLSYDLQNQIAPPSQSLSSEGGGRGKRGILTLDEVWCTWNRLRGIALIPPATLLSTLPHVVTGLTEPRIFYTTLPKSGLRIVHLEEFTEVRVRQRLLARLNCRSSEEQTSPSSWRVGSEAIDNDLAGLEQEQGDPVPPLLTTTTTTSSIDYGPTISTLELAQVEGISILLTRELLHLVEMESGAIVRDQGPYHTFNGDSRRRAAADGSGGALESRSGWGLQEGGGGRGGVGTGTGAGVGGEMIWWRNRFEELAC